MFRIVAILSVAMGLVLVAAPPQRAVSQEEKKPAAKEARTPDVVYVPTPHDVVDKMLDMAKVKKGDVVLDLGCGDGRIVVAAAKKGAKATGYDINRNGSPRPRPTSRRTR